MQTPIPVVLVSGFLGAGKTTFMRRLVRDCGARGLKAALIINEFGTADVDSSLLQEADAELLSSVAGGCACCTGVDDFVYALLDVGRRQGNAQPDLILIESSGLADPVLMLDALTLSNLLPLVRVASLITVVDSARLLTLPDAAMPLLMRQLKLADLIVLNKTDLATSNDSVNSLAEVQSVLESVNPHARIEAAKHGQINLDALWQRVFAAQTNGENRRRDAGNAAPHAHFQTLTLPLSQAIERRHLEKALRELSPDVWRVKGFVPLRDENGLFLLQYSFGNPPQWELEALHIPPLSRNKPRPVLVFIGPHLDPSTLQRQFTRNRALTLF